MNNADDNSNYRSANGIRYPYSVAARQALNIILPGIGVAGNIRTYADHSEATRAIEVRLIAHRQLRDSFSGKGNLTSLHLHLKPVTLHDYEGSGYDCIMRDTSKPKQIIPIATNIETDKIPRLLGMWNKDERMDNIIYWASQFGKIHPDFEHTKHSLTGKVSIFNDRYNPQTGGMESIKADAPALISL